MDSISRRQVLRGGTAGLAASGVEMAGAAQKKTTIGIQVPAISFLDEGVDEVLDIFQQRAGVNTVYLAVFAYSRGIAGRQLPGHPLPDHGKQQYDEFHGGNYCRIRPQYYKQDTGVRPEDTRAPDHGDTDIAEMVFPAVKKRGMRAFLWAEDVWRPDIPNVDRILEVDLHGRVSRRPCYHNPYYRNFLASLTEDWVRSYDVDGVMWCMEATGALSNALSFRTLGCFCQHCVTKARKQGSIDLARTRKGFDVLGEFLRSCREGQQPVDGYYVTFWRILLRYPEIMAWEHFWHEGLRETYQAIYERVKTVRPGLQCGWHIQHPNSFDYLYRAERDLRELTPYSDFLKIVMYNNCAGERMASHINRIRRGAFGDFTNEQLLEFSYRVLNYRERGFDQIPYTGLSSDYVYREARRAVEGVAGTSTEIYPGIDIGVPTAPEHSKRTPQSTRDAVAAAFRAQPHGVILSRKYSEMKLTDLSGAGEAIRELGLA